MPVAEERPWREIPKDFSFRCIAENGVAIRKAEFEDVVLAEEACTIGGGGRIHPSRHREFSEVIQGERCRDDAARRTTVEENAAHVSELDGWEHAARARDVRERTMPIIAGCVSHGRTGLLVELPVADQFGSCCDVWGCKKSAKDQHQTKDHRVSMKLHEI